MGVGAAVTVRDMDVTAETIGIYSCRVTEVSAHTSLEAIDNNEGMFFNRTTQHKIRQKLNQKCNHASFEAKKATIIDKRWLNG